MNFLWQPSAKHSSSVNGYFYVASGGIAFGGSPAYARGRAWLPTGGIVWGGTAEVLTSHDPRLYEYTMTGGIQWGGTFPVLGHTWTSIIPPEEEVSVWTGVEGF